MAFCLSMSSLSIAAPVQARAVSARKGSAAATTPLRACKAVGAVRLSSISSSNRALSLVVRAEAGAAGDDDEDAKTASAFDDDDEDAAPSRGRGRWARSCSA
eukprot:CAMPEP_0197613522 /NCGR_PEP_ID=MMETSP1326-20131121/59063_1 /TAXON_ID=1155430 /ORGANISM="Genus nov. species nov., Strain RCC2288" /LENGTH=101 /DNA_ID=CAMNT_0043182385 /DNA_START=411 /DNA_END=713 /DNA_ORIENTATION=-